MAIDTNTKVATPRGNAFNRRMKQEALVVSSIIDEVCKHRYATLLAIQEPLSFLRGQSGMPRAENPGSSLGQHLRHAGGCLRETCARNE